MVKLLQGDCLDVLKSLAENSIDAVVTDPPYHLTSIVKRFGKPGSAPAQYGTDGAYARASKGFMGKEWDGGDISFRPETWAEILRVMKPGAHLVAFGGSRTFHRVACAIEDAGFEIRDQIMWLYGSGFPKSHNLEGDWEGWGSALKPAHEPICMARKPLVGTIIANVLAHGTGAINIDGCRVKHQTINGGNLADNSHLRGHINGGNGGNIITHEVARRVVVPNDLGRWPANIIHDGSPEVLAEFPDSKGQQGNVRGSEPSHTGDENANCYGEFDRVPFQKRSDSGSAARFFYCTKASKSDREEGNVHPTVKPTSLMQYLCRLITPTGGIILDPFMGSGLTGKAAVLEGFDFIGIERDDSYMKIAEARVMKALSDKFI